MIKVLAFLEGAYLVLNYFNLFSRHRNVESMQANNSR